jgi:hypothetical protein
MVMFGAMMAEIGRRPTVPGLGELDGLAELGLPEGGVVAVAVVAQAVPPPRRGS